MEPSINEIMLKSLKELDLSAAICAKQAKQEVLLMASICDESNTYLRKLMENDITDKDFQDFKAFAANATKIMNWIMRYDTKEA